MTTLQILTVKTNAALSRLASLQRRAEKIARPPNGLVGNALKELNDALDELRVANDELQSKVTELASARTNVAAVERRLADFLHVVPVACVWTTVTGEIVEANPAAASLLNVSRPYLAGRPLVVFLTDRTRMLNALAELSARLSWAVDFDGAIRPRERRVRAVQVSGRRLDADDRLCWFLIEQERGRGAEGAD